MRMILSTGNPGKVREFREILSDSGLELLTPAEAGIDLDVEETGVTFEENSYLKAYAACRATGLPALADDSGICADALGGAPGVYSARYGGKGLDDDGRRQLLVENMRGKTDRNAQFVCAVTCVFPGGDTLRGRGVCRGVLLEEDRGENGFGYDPIFYLPALGKTTAELSPEEKNAVSHRGAAIRDFKMKLDAYLRAREKGRTEMLTGKQRAQLRALANTVETILIVGKGGVTENVLAQARDALTARELIKGRVLDASLLTAREAADILAEKCGAETVQTIGSRFVLYRRNPKKGDKQRECRKTPHKRIPGRKIR